MSQRRWSQYVTEHSNALDLPRGIFTWDDPEQIARALVHAAEVSSRRKGTAYQSAMSMLNFYINRAGQKLSSNRKYILEQAKTAMRTQHVALP